jgi:hypothetical protein
MPHALEEVLGKSIAAPEVVRVVAEFGLRPHTTPDGEVYLIGSGIRLWTTEHDPRTVPTVTLFSEDAVQQPDDGDAGVFTSQLPCGLEWGARLDDVAALFDDPPARVGAGLGDRAVFGDWAGFWLGTHGLHTDFGARGLRQIMLLLHPPGWP